MGFRRLLAGLGFAAAAALAPAALAAPAGDRDADDAAIARVLADEDAAWAKGDADAFAARAADDVVFTNIVGMFSVGKAPFVAQHHRIFTTIYQGSAVRQFVEHVAFAAPGVAIVSSVAKLTGFKELPPSAAAVDGALYTRLLQVLVRSGADWRVAAFHNVVIQPQFVDAKVLALTGG